MQKHSPAGKAGVTGYWTARSNKGYMAGEGPDKYKDTEELLRLLVGT
jgi:hypothetical protein